MVVDRPRRGPVRVFVMPPSVSSTVFARLYFTGSARPDDPAAGPFRLVADGYPHYRIFRVDVGG
jgi:hypothetical protein